ncbi:Uncharacterised protein [Chlamydia trachomatis]|nr:Uncharacterised protein [Chlamydia trachomatis]
MKVAKPKAPESTTPFSLRTGNKSGVRATDSYASTTIASRSSCLVACFCSSLSAQSDTSFKTVRMVPSTGFLTALKATFTPFRKAFAMSSTLRTSSVAPTRPSLIPRKIWLVITPELPRAPISDPCVIACAISSIDAS